MVRIPRQGEAGRVHRRRRPSVLGGRVVVHDDEGGVGAVNGIHAGIGEGIGIAHGRCLVTRAVAGADADPGVRRPLAGQEAGSLRRGEQDDGRRDPDSVHRLDLRGTTDRLTDRARLGGHAGEQQGDMGRGA